MPYLQSRLNAIFRSAADRVGVTYLDETAMMYEAARLAQHSAVIAVYQEANNWHFTVVKGEDAVVEYLKGESSNLDLEALIVDDAATAQAFRAAMIRHGKPTLRLVGA